MSKLGKCHNRENGNVDVLVCMWWSKHKPWANSDLHYIGGGGLIIPCRMINVKVMKNGRDRSQPGVKIMDFEKRCLNAHKVISIDHKTCVRWFKSRFLIFLFQQLVKQLASFRKLFVVRACSCITIKIMLSYSFVVSLPFTSLSSKIS